MLKRVRLAMSVTVVTACRRGALGGSPTAVVWPDTSPDDSVRQALPARIGTSHAVFVTMDGPVATLRFFTSAGELPACGHGTVAAIAVLAADGPVQLRVSGRRFLGRAVHVGDGIEALFEPPPAIVRAAQPYETELVAAALGIKAAAAAVASLGESGRPRLLLPVADGEALALLKPDFEQLRETCDRLGLLGCYAYTLLNTDNEGAHLAARMFAPSIGVPEDIANANSTACLATRRSSGTCASVSVFRSGSTPGSSA